MNKRIIILGITFSLMSIISFSQEVQKETLKKGDTETNLTIIEGKIYEGSNSEKARDYYNAAISYEKKDDLKNAKKNYLKAIKEDSKYIEAYDNLGLIYRRIGDFDNAIKYYKKSIGIYPKGEMAHQNLAVVYSLQKDYYCSINEYEEILKISPNNPEGYFGIANNYLALSKFEDALVNAKQAVEIYEKTNSHHIADGYQMIGLIYYYQKDDENAKKYLKVAKEKGARIHPKIEEELFEKSQVKSFKLETKEDYVKYEKDVIDGYSWLMKTPVGEETKKRKEISSFLMQWMSGSPNVSIELSEKIVTYMDCGECLIIFMSGWTKYALETKDFDNKFKGNLAGTKSVIKFYNSNKNVLGKNKSIEKFVKLDKENKLEDYINSNM